MNNKKKLRKEIIKNFHELENQKIKNPTFVIKMDKNEYSNYIGTSSLPNNKHTRIEYHFSSNSISYLEKV